MKLILLKQRQYRKTMKIKMIFPRVRLQNYVETASAATQSFDFASKNMVTSKPNGTEKYWKLFHLIIVAAPVWQCQPQTV